MKINAAVTDTNHRSKGRMAVWLTLHAGTPDTVLHEGESFFATGRTGTSQANGLPVFEMATERDARLWITAAGDRLWED